MDFQLMSSGPWSLRVKFKIFQTENDVLGILDVDWESGHAWACQQ